MRLSQGYSLTFWLILILLTISLLLSPTNFTPEQHPIESLYVFNNFLLFAALYHIWLAVLILLLFSPGKVNSEQEKLALVGIFAMVFIGFWLVTSPNAGFKGEGLMTAGFVRHFIQENIGKVPSEDPYLGFHNFPGIMLLALLLHAISVLPIANTLTLLLFFHLLLLATLLFILFNVSF